MSKQNKEDRRRELTIELECLEKRILDCFFVVEREVLEKQIKKLNRELKLCE